MTIRAALAATALTLAAATSQVGAHQPSRTGATELEGAWVVVSYETPGVSRPIPADMETRLTFKGDKVGMKGAAFRMGRPTSDEVMYAFDLDVTAKPKALTLKQESIVVSAVYEISGDTLRLVMSRPGGPRPVNVSSDAGVLYQLEKAK